MAGLYEKPIADRFAEGQAAVVEMFKQDPIADQGQGLLVLLLVSRSMMELGIRVA